MFALRSLSLKVAAPLSSSSSSSPSLSFSTSVYEKTLKPKLLQQLEEIKEAGTFKRERVITSPQRASISVQESPEPVLNFCANNYLGLSDNPRIVAAAHAALESHAFGYSSVRFICGTTDIHKQLEHVIADFHHKDDSILYAACFDANGGIFEALLGPDDALFSDELNHASIIDGIRLCKARKFKYEHFRFDQLEDMLKQATAEGVKTKLIVTDGVFSMDGDITPLDKVCDLADAYDALVFVDECHATGFLGPTGRGTPELYNVMDRVDIINSTLGKALGGGSGGYTTAAAEIISVLRQKSRPYLFSNTLAPPIVGASLEVFRLLNESLDAKKRLEENTSLFRKRMTEAGFKLGGSIHPIAPVMLGDARLASIFSEELLKRGIYAIGFSYPVVPKGKARIRIQLSAAHTLSQVNRCVDAFIDIGRSLKVIS